MGRAKIVRTCRSAMMLSPDKHRYECRKQAARDKARAVAGAARDYAPMEKREAMERIQRKAERDALAWKKKRDAERATASTAKLPLSYPKRKRGEL